MGMKSLEQYRADFIDVIKRTMATNLKNKGTAANSTEFLQALADKIANVNTGKKWASGSFTSSETGLYTISGLSFTPSLVILYVNTTDTDSFVISILLTQTVRYYVKSGDVGSWFKITNLSISQANQYVRSASLSYDVDNSQQKINSNGFTINLYGTGSYRNYSWIAIE